jgi:hypothetical protein
MLQLAAVPANVLLSKSDLLGTEDRKTVIAYAKQHIASECKLELHVSPVSVLPSHKNLLSLWFEEQILPLYGRSQELRMSSLRRKIGVLRESVISALEVQLERSQKSTGERPDEVRATEARLRRAAGLIEETRSAWEQEIEKIAEDLPEAFSEMCARLIEAWSGKQELAISTEKIVADFLLQFARRRVKKLHDSLQALAIQLRDDLRTSAANLSIMDVPGDEEFQSLVRGTPVFDPGSVSAPEYRPTIALMLGTRFAERRLARRLYKQLGPSISNSLGTYLEVLKEWVRLVTSQVDRRFETYAERYRAQAERSLGGAALTAEEVSAIEENLRVLRVPQTFHFVEADSKRGPQNQSPETVRDIARHAHKGELS